MGLATGFDYIMASNGTMALIMNIKFTFINIKFLMCQNLKGWICPSPLPFLN
jgi:hypothetical protein